MDQPAKPPALQPVHSSIRATQPAHRNLLDRRGGRRCEPGLVSRDETARFTRCARCREAMLLMSSLKSIARCKN